MERIRLIGFDSSQCTRMTLSASAPTTYRRVRTRDCWTAVVRPRRQRVSFPSVGPPSLFFLSHPPHFWSPLLLCLSPLSLYVISLFSTNRHRALLSPSRLYRVRPPFPPSFPPPFPASPPPRKGLARTGARGPPPPPPPPPREGQTTKHPPLPGPGRGPAPAWPALRGARGGPPNNPFHMARGGRTGEKRDEGGRGAGPPPPPTPHHGEWRPFAFLAAGWPPNPPYCKWALWVPSFCRPRSA